VGCGLVRLVRGGLDERELAQERVVMLLRTAPLLHGEIEHDDVDERGLVRRVTVCSFGVRHQRTSVSDATRVLDAPAPGERRTSNQTLFPPARASTPQRAASRSISRSPWPVGAAGS